MSTATRRSDTTAAEQKYSRQRARFSYATIFSILTAVILAALPTVTHAHIHELTQDNYDAVTKGKAVFIKFYAPWCSYSKRLEKDWDALAQEWEDHEVGLVAEVDCTDHEHGGKPLCKYLNIESYPTLKFGDPYDLEEYKGGRSFEELDAFATANLVPVCSVDNLDLCDADLRERLEQYLKMDEAKLRALMTQEEIKLQAAEQEFQKLVDGLSAKYEAAEKERRKAIDEVMNGVLPSMRAVLTARKRSTENNNSKSKEEL